MTILITNDDGLHAAGIRALEAGVAQMGDAVVGAPSEERSGASHALTMHSVLRLRQESTDRYAVDGTPVDCVYVGGHQVLKRKPDIVLSGINRGANLGDDVFYSGTVGAAREAALMGIPSLAASLHLDGERAAESPHFESAVFFVRQVTQRMLSMGIPTGTFLNLNVPDQPLSSIQGLKLCPLGRRHYRPLIDARTDPRGRPYYWIGGEPGEDAMAEGTDGWWISRGWATLSPVSLNQTAQDALDVLQGQGFVPDDT